MQTLSIREKVGDIRRRHGLRKGLMRQGKLCLNRIFFSYSADRLKRDLNALGINHGDVVFVHSALSKIGYVRGGAHSVIRALIEAVSPEGTLLMPAYPMRGNAYKYVSTNPVFDVGNTPTGSGTIAEVFRTMSGVSRSLHPTHSVCAWGQDSDFFVDGHEKQIGPFGFGTPFYKFMERGGKGLILGAKLGNFTVLRCIEDIREDYPYPAFCDRIFKLTVVDKEGNEFIVNTKVHSGIADTYRNVDGLLLPQFKKDGMLTEGKVGNADSYLVKGEGLYEYMEGLLARNITPWKQPFPSFPG